MLGGRSNTSLYLWASSINLRGRRKKEEGRRKKEEGRRKREEGRGKEEEGRRKKEEGKCSQSNIVCDQKCPNLLASYYKLIERSH